MFARGPHFLCVCLSVRTPGWAQICLWGLLMSLVWGICLVAHFCAYLCCTEFFLNAKLPESVSPPDEALLLRVLFVRSPFWGAYLLHRVYLNAKLPESVTPPNEALLLRVCLSGQFLVVRICCTVFF